MKRLLAILRYNPYFSKLILVCVWPFMVIGRFAQWLKYRVKINGGAVVYYGYRLVFPKNVGVNISSKIHWFGDSGFEKEFGKYMIASLKRSDLFFDIGSNFGFYSVLACKTSPSIFSYCFEPVDFLQQDNLRFHRLNEVNNFELVKKALGDADGSTTILIPTQKNFRFLITSATLSKDFANEKGFDVAERQIEIQRLDSFVKKAIEDGKLKPGKKITIKIDVEGFEYAVLKGAADTFLLYRPVVLIEIFMKEEIIEGIYQFLSVVKYNLYAFSGIGLVKLDRNTFYRYKGDRNFVLLPGEIEVSSLLTFSDFENSIFQNRTKT